MLLKNLKKSKVNCLKTIPKGCGRVGYLNGFNVREICVTEGPEFTSKGNPKTYHHNFGPPQRPQNLTSRRTIY